MNNALSETNYDQIPFRTILVQAMSDHQMTVREAAQAAGVAISTVQNWRSGHQPTNFDAVQKLAWALGLSLSYLLTGREDPCLQKKSLRKTSQIRHR